MNDLQLTGDVSAITLVDRPRHLDTGEDDVTGAPIETDGRMALVVLRPPPTAVPAAAESVALGVSSAGDQ